MTNMRCQVVIRMFSNLPTDVITNTLHFVDTTPGLSFADAVAAIQPSVTAFYNACYATVGLATYAIPTTVQAHWYNLDTAKPRVPLIVDMPLTAPGQTSVVPTECAAVISFQGARESGNPQARRRGRIYLGGLTTNMMSASSGGAYPRFSPTYVAQLAAAADTFKSAVLGADRFWAVYSPTDNEMVPITDGWVDDSPDTQRRRSVDTNVRTLWS